MSTTRSKIGRARTLETATDAPSLAGEVGLPVDTNQEFDHLDHMRDLKKQAHSVPMKRRIPR